MGKQHTSYASYTKFIGAVPVVLAVILGAAMYSKLPESMASHWGVSGEVDGYMSKLWGVWFLPLFMAGLHGLFLLFPRIDPRAKDFSKFQGVWQWLVFSIQGLLFYLYALMLYWNAYGGFDFVRAISLGLGLLFIVLGWQLPKIEQNWFMGIRTPWTMESKDVWQRTHKVGGRLFMLLGIATLATVVMPSLAFYVVISGAVGVAAATMTYSYVIFKRQ